MSTHKIHNDQTCKLKTGRDWALLYWCPRYWCYGVFQEGSYFSQQKQLVLARQTDHPAKNTHTKIYFITVINLIIRFFSWTIILDSFSIKLKPKLGLWTIFCNQSYKSREIFQAKPAPKQNSKLCNKNHMTLPDLNRAVKHCSLLSEFKVR